MRRSNKVAAPLLAAAALSMLTGCRKPEMQRCVDENNKVVDDSLCENQPNAQQQQNQQQQNQQHGGSIVPFLLYHYYYGGYGGFGLGSIVGGGSITPDPSRSYTTRSGVTTRGGFGRSMSSGSHSSGGAGE